MIVDRYYYSQLNKQEQAVYKAFYSGLMEHKDIIPVPIKGRLSQDVFNRIFLAMTRDNPLIYYVNQSACSSATDMFGHTAICPQYFYSKEKVWEYNKKIETAVNNLAGQLKLTEGTDYEKEIRIHDWFCKNVKYDFKGNNIEEPIRVIMSHNIIGVFAKHKAQCEGIAKAVKVLLNAVDIKCIVATGNANGNGQNGPHAWNIVNIEGSPYQLDVTWDIGASCGRIAYDYFNVTDEIINKTHKADFKLPDCTSLKFNYFERNKLIFKSKSQLIEYLRIGVNQGETEFYFRMDGVFTRIRASEIAELVARIASEVTKRSIRLQQVPNEKVGTYWMKLC